jgi:hypothetical protein
MWRTCAYQVDTLTLEPVSATESFSPASDSNGSNILVIKI